MSKDAKIEYLLKDFPFDKLRVGRVGMGYTLGDTYNHLYTYVETAPGQLEQFVLVFPGLKMPSITYYVDPKADPRKPSFYGHPCLHPAWAEKDPKTGAPRHATSANGLVVERFSEQFDAAVARELAKMSLVDAARLMGVKQGQKPGASLAPTVAHGKFPKDHKTKPGFDDPDSSKTFKFALWTQEKDRADANPNRKRKSEAADAPSDEYQMPADLNLYMYTAWHEKLGEGAPKRKHMDYTRDTRRYMYSAKGHRNASSQLGDMIAYTKMLAPSVVYKPGENAEGRLQYKAKEIFITRFEPRSRSDSISDERVAELEADTSALAEEFGFAKQQTPLVDEEEAARAAKRARTDEGPAGTHMEQDESGAWFTVDEYGVATPWAPDSPQ